MIQKTLIRRKIIVSVIIILVIIGGYFGYKALKGGKNEIRYTLAKVEKGTLISSVSGSGQISASNQVDIKSKASGDAVYVGIKNGQEVRSGALLAQIDSTAAQKTVRDAETSLETAKLELEELLQPADAYDLMQAEDSLTQAKDSLTKLKFTQETNYQNTLDTIDQAEDDLKKSYEDAFNTISNAFLDLPTIITALNDVLYSYQIDKDEVTIVNVTNLPVLENSISLADSKSRSEFKQFSDSSENNYKLAKTKYDANFKNYKVASRYSDKTTIEKLLDETIETVKSTAETVKSDVNLLDYWVDYCSRHDSRIYTRVTTYQTDLKSYTSKTNSHLSSLLSAQKTIKDDQEAKLNAERDLTEAKQNNPIDLAAAERNVKAKEESLAKLKAGADALDVRAKKIIVQQKQDALADAKQNLADHYIYAPFAGIITSVNAKKGESISTGATLATLITKQKIAEISLNEIDAAKVKVGQKATLTFDAIEGLSITGEVIDLDTIGTVSQGVVTYNVKINFDTQDERVKPGMSVSASIITEVKQDVLLIPNSAVKTSDDTYHTEILDSTVIPKESMTNKITITSKISPQQQSIQIGSANDSSTEIISGLKEGDWVITGTSSSSTTQSQQSQTKDTFRIPGVGGMGVPR